MPVQFVAGKCGGPLDGDYSTNGAVDAADFTVWRDNLGTNFDMPSDSTPGSVEQVDTTNGRRPSEPPLLRLLPRKCS